MVKTARVYADQNSRWMVGDNDRNPFNPREEAELANQQRDAKRRRLRKLRQAANGEEAND